MKTTINMDQVLYYVTWERYEMKDNRFKLIYKPGDIIKSVKWFRKHKKVCEDYIYQSPILGDHTWSELVKMGFKDIEQDSNGIIYYKPGITYYLNNGQKISRCYDRESDLQHKLYILNMRCSSHMISID